MPVAGTLTLTQNNTTVTGSGTSFTTALAAGGFLVATVGGTAYTLGIKSIESNTSLTLQTAYNGPTASGVAFDYVPMATLNLITSALAAQVTYALRAANLDKNNWQQIFSGTGNVTVTLPDGSNWTGPAWNNVAAKGVNSDITKLKGLVSDGSTWLEEADLAAGEGEKGINLTSNNSTGVSFGTESTNGGASVFHNFTKGVGGSNAKDKMIIGGYGSRPFNGSIYSAHSNAAIHFVQDGDASTTNEGGWLRLLVTPKGKTVSSRFASFLLSNNGDTYIGKDIHPSGFDGTQYQSNFPDFNGRGLKQVINNVNELHLVSGVTAGSSCSGNLRFNACGGSPLNPGPVQAGSTMYVSLSGFDGATWSSAAALMQLSTPATWSQTSRPGEITFATTALNSITRYNRWIIQNDGHFAPVFDNNVSIGWSQKRITALYAVNGTIQTSDARLKTDVRELTENEVKAACALSKEIGFWKWKDKLEAEGDKARSHIGMTVQRAIEIMKSFGLEPMSYGFICYDSWGASKEVTHYDGNGAEISTEIPAGDRYSFRYEQLNLFIARGFEYRLARIEEELSL